MPFTLAHPIAIIPVWYASRRYLDFTALCLGSMMPDLDRFIPMVPEGGHTLRGIITIDIPWAILLLLILRWIIARPFLALLPPYLASCFARPAMPGVFTGVLSIAIGALSHIVWDSFTHATGWFVVRYSVLQTTIGRWPLYELLQHGCGLAGLIAIALWIAWWLGQAHPQSGKQTETLPLAYRLVIVTVIAMVAILTTLLDIKAGVRLQQPRGEIVASGVVGGITGMGLSFLIYSLCFLIFPTPTKRFGGKS
jgi:Domain of unknown function (DUF4184)